MELVPGFPCQGCHIQRQVLEQNHAAQAKGTREQIQAPVVSSEKNSDRTSSVEESKTLSEETTHDEVISPAHGNSQPDSEVVADFSLTQDSEMESENHPSQSTLSQLIERDDVIWERKIPSTKTKSTGSKMST